MLKGNKCWLDVICLCQFPVNNAFMTSRLVRRGKSLFKDCFEVFQYLPISFLLANEMISKFDKNLHVKGFYIQINRTHIIMIMKGCTARVNQSIKSSWLRPFKVRRYFKYRGFSYKYLSLRPFSQVELLSSLPSLFCSLRSESGSCNLYWRNPIWDRDSDIVQIREIQRHWKRMPWF